MVFASAVLMLAGNRRRSSELQVHGVFVFSC